MLPSQLTAADFKSYPEQARVLAANHVSLLRQLPLSFAPFLLKEIISFDSKFPAERTELDQQLAYLETLPTADRQRELARFERLQLAPDAQAFDWVNSPAQFLEQLSAHLWATHQTDEFRGASEQYVHKFHASLPERKLPAPRVGVVVVGQGVAQNAAATRSPLFRKLRPMGVHFTQVNAANGWPSILAAAKARAAAHPETYAHWYIDGGAASSNLPGLTVVSYEALKPVRAALAAKMLEAYESPKFDPELLRSTLAQVSPESLGMASPSGDKALDRFALSLLTEGSGTQIYSTTFVQWAAREALRRAQPLTLVVRYAPRQKERSMSELLTGKQDAAAADPIGSLVDADMGAYYTWLNQQRLTEAARTRFLVWFENGNEALAISPGLKPGTINSSSIDVPSLLQEYILGV